jgi:hypothetical protein
MSRTIEVTDDAVIVRLTGVTAAAALKRDLRIPLAAVRAVSTDRFLDEGWRVAGTSLPFTEIRAGRFRRHGHSTFVSFEDRDRVVSLFLDRAVQWVAYDTVAVGADDPEAVAAEIERRRGRFARRA